MNYTEKGSKLYLFSIVLVAVIGGLLFGYALPLPVHLSDVSSVVLFRDSSHPIWDVRILFS